jgi:ubiquinone/menaquinone biosynthesis C-methylase UbiE
MPVPTFDPPPSAVTEATAWEVAYQRFETPEQERQKFLRRLRNLGAHRWDRRTGVLEICSGRGSGLAAWRALGFLDVYGLDLSVALVMASDLHRSSVVGDARRLPFRTASRDVAVVQGGLHHLPDFDDVRAALAEMRRVLKPDGRVIIIEPWLTPFLRVVHFVTKQPLARAMSNRLDAFAAMTDEERPTYEAWLARRDQILATVAVDFEPVVVRKRWGKLVFVGRPRPR